jgi:hypothetical protein
LQRRPGRVVDRPRPHQASRPAGRIRMEGNRRERRIAALTDDPGSRRMRRRNPRAGGNAYSRNDAAAKTESSRLNVPNPVDADAVPSPSDRSCRSRFSRRRCGHAEARFSDNNPAMRPQSRP